MRFSTLSSFYPFFRLSRYLPSFRGGLLFAVFFVVLFLSSCGLREVNDDHLKQYFESLPKLEEGNASVYNHELTLEKMSAALIEKDYLRVIEIYEKYEDAFFESGIEDVSEVDFLVGNALYSLWASDGGVETFEAYLRKPLLRRPLAKNTDIGAAANYSKDGANSDLEAGLQSEKKLQRSAEQRKRTLLLKDENFISPKDGRKKPIAFFEKLIEDRQNYTLEREAMRMVFYERLQQVNTSADHSKNLKFLEWSLRHYPDLLDYRNVLENPIFFNHEFASKKQISTEENIDFITGAQKGEALPVAGMVFLAKHPSIVLRNRPDKIYSRNLEILQAWHPIRLLALHQGEDGEPWFSVSIRSEARSSGVGLEQIQLLPPTLLFLPADTPLIAYALSDAQDNLKKLMNLYPNITSFRVEAEKANKKAFSNLGVDEFWKEYSEAYRLYTQKDFFSSIEILAGLEGKLAGLPRELELVLFYNNLKNISMRSTSLQNPYTDFVKRFPLLFVSVEQGLFLLPSDDFLIRLQQENPDTNMLQYFDGLPKI